MTNHYLDNTTTKVALFNCFGHSVIIYNNNIYCNLRPRAHVHITLYHKSTWCGNKSTCRHNQSTCYFCLVISRLAATTCRLVMIYRLIATTSRVVTISRLVTTCRRCRILLNLTSAPCLNKSTCCDIKSMVN